MTSSSGADLDELLELRRVLGRRSDDMRRGALTVGRALDHFRDSSTEYVPPLRPHRARGTDLAEQIDSLGRRVAATRDALAAADRWVGETAGAAVFAAARDVPRVVDAGNAASEVWARWRLSATMGDDVALIGHRAFIDAGAGGHFARSMGRQQVVDSIADVRHVVGRGGPQIASAGAAGRVGRAVQRFGASRAGAITRLGTRTAGVVSIGLSAAEVVQGYRAGDEEQMVTGALGTAASIAVMSGFPPAQLAGALVSGGLLLYEYREEIADVGRAVGRGVSAAATAARDFVDGLF